jgi:type IX secretion system PorP/SprF family membrane protein
MRQIIRRAFSILLTASLPVMANAQDIHFSQFYETSILRNPALTGVFNGDYKVGATYRQQWNSISKPFQTGMVSAEMRFAMNNKEVSDYFTFGLLSYFDKAGSAGQQTITVYPSINFNKSLEDNNNSYLSVGFTGGYVQRSVDPTKMTFDNQYQGNHYDPANGTGESITKPSFSYWDLGAGICFSSSTGSDSRYGITYYAGVSGYHFTQPTTSYFNNDMVRLGMKWNGTAGMSMALNETYSLQFHANYMLQGDYSELIAGGLVGWNKLDYNEQVSFALFAGVFYRLQDALIPTVKLRYKDYSIAASYDMNVSGLSEYSAMRGGYEITAFKTGLFKNPKMQKSRTICPHSFW